MKATGDFLPLEHLAARTGHVLVKLKKLRVPAGAGTDTQNDLHESFLEAQKRLSDFFRVPTPENKDKVLSALDVHLGETLAARAKAETWEQPELDLE